MGNVRSALLDSCTWAVENILNTFFGSAASIDGLRVWFSTPTAFSVGFMCFLSFLNFVELLAIVDVYFVKKRLEIQIIQALQSL